VRATGQYRFTTDRRFFDTTAERGIVDARSTLGKWLAKFKPDEFKAFDEKVDSEIQQAKLPAHNTQETLTKPGRQSAFDLGSTIVVETDRGNVLLYALCQLRLDGSRCVACALDEQALDEALRRLWKKLSHSPVREDLFIPLVGSGFGSIKHDSALAHILLTFRAAEARADARLCPNLNIVVFHNDWGDGLWARRLFEGLLM
jgi:hypothetical protein